MARLRLTAGGTLDVLAEHIRDVCFNECRRCYVITIIDGEEYDVTRESYKSSGLKPCMPVMRRGMRMPRDFTCSQ